MALLSFWGKGKKRGYPTLILSPDGIKWEHLAERVGEPWVLVRRGLWGARRSQIWVAVSKNGYMEPFSPPYRQGEWTPADLRFLIDQRDVFELFKPTSGLLQKIEVGILVALTLGLGFLLFIFWESAKAKPPVGG